jgi:hypothetical protein
MVSATTRVTPGQAGYARASTARLFFERDAVVQRHARGPRRRKRVANVVESIASLGAKDLLAAKSGTRRKSCSTPGPLVAPKDLPPVRVVSTAQVMRAMDALDRLLARKPAEAKEARLHRREHRPDPGRGPATRRS